MYRYDEEDRYIPPRKLEENRSFVKFLLLTIFTLGIYGIIFFISFSFDLDKVASRHDGKKTMNYLFAYLLSSFTLTVVMIVWFYGVSERITEELERREIDNPFTMSDFWMWYVVGSLFLVGPLVYHYKMLRAMNQLCRAYNEEQEAIVRELNQKSR